MAHNGKSGKIVVTIEPDLKRRLYASLSMSGITLKDWFRKSAAAYCDENSAYQRFNTAGVSVSALPQRRKALREAPGLYGRENQRGHHAPYKYTVVSMFSGCGGMDLGFVGGFEIFGRRYDALPYEIIWANDLNPEACRTYRLNMGHDIMAGDIWQLMERVPKSADVLMGGFPCQDVSVNGKRAGVNGKRSGLYKAMVEAIRRIKPKVFVAENVKALLRNEQWLNQVVGDFEGLGYNLHYQLYQAADYGIPQTRERVLFVGTARDMEPYAPPAPERSAAAWMTAYEAISDLEEMPQNPGFNHIWSLASKSPQQGNRKLLPHRPGYTIRAECHGNIQYHYRLPRRISMREAARIQSFPDKFLFVSGLRETERQVGNAVPPVLAWHVANSILTSLRTAQKQNG